MGDGAFINPLFEECLRHHHFSSLFIFFSLPVSAKRHSFFFYSLIRQILYVHLCSCFLRDPQKPQNLRITGKLVFFLGRMPFLNLHITVLCISFLHPRHVDTDVHKLRIHYLPKYPLYTHGFPQRIFHNLFRFFSRCEFNRSHKSCSRLADRLLPHTNLSPLENGRYCRKKEGRQHNGKKSNRIADFICFQTVVG